MFKVLVADDERALRVLIAGTLEIGNYEIIEAENGLQALDLVKQERPDLVILDVMMPGLTGLQVSKRIKTDPEIMDTKILILTAKGQQSDRNSAMDALADFYLAKPFSPMELLSLVEDILSRKVNP